MKVRSIDWIFVCTYLYPHTTYPTNVNPFPTHKQNNKNITTEFFPFGPESVDLVISSMSAHWVNDLPGYFTSVRKSLKPDGAFLCAMLGGETLQELRSALAVAEQERIGGVRPHISPFAKIRDAGNLLQSAGFSLPTVDSESITCMYPDMFTLLDHLQGMGETNAIADISPSVNLQSDSLMAAAAAYQELYADENGLIPATFEVIYVIGWSPHESQPKGLERGSATSHLAELESLK